MNISEHGFSLIFLLRQIVGKDKVDIGPDIDELIEAWDPDLTLSDLRTAIEELETINLIQVNRGIPTDQKATPGELRGIVSVSVKETLQEYYDKLEID